MRQILFVAFLLLFAGTGYADTAGTASGTHGGGYDLELPEGTTGPTPGADCQALDPLCAANSYGNTESSLDSANNCDPKCDVWVPSDGPGFAVFEAFRGDPRNYIHGSWRYPALPWTETHPEGSGEQIWRYGTVTNDLTLAMRIPFRGGSIYSGNVNLGGACDGCGGDPWSRINQTITLSDTPGSATPLDGQTGCQMVANGGIQFIDETFLGSDAYSDILRDLYCVMEPGTVYWVNHNPNNANCGVSETCRTILEVLPTNHTFWDHDPQDQSDLLPWAY